MARQSFCLPSPVPHERRWAVGTLSPPPLPKHVGLGKSSTGQEGETQQTGGS